MKEKQIIALEHLATFKLLTSSQFVRLGLYKHRGDVTNTLKPLLNFKRPLIGKKNFQPDPSYGKVESIYYLTKYGRDYLVKNLYYQSESIRYIKNPDSLFKKEYNHRKSTINFHIGLKQWIDSVDGDILFCTTYFDKVGNNRQKNTSKYVYALSRIVLSSGEAFTPDLTTMFNVNNKEYLFLFEQHNDSSTTRLLKQLLPYLKAISEGVIENQLGFQKSPRIVVVCKYDKIKHNIIKRLKEDSRFNNFHNFFIFKSNSDLEQNFNENWTLINGEKVSFIQPKSTK